MYTYVQHCILYMYLIFFQFSKIFRKRVKGDANTPFNLLYIIELVCACVKKVSRILSLLPSDRDFHEEALSCLIGAWPCGL